MRLTGDDLGRLHAKPRLVAYLFEPVPNPGYPPHCARLISYWKIAINQLEMLRHIDGLGYPSNVQGPRLSEQSAYREDDVALLIENFDTELRGMLLAQQMPSDAELSAVAHVYARIVLGSESDPNCDQILTSLRQAGFRVPGACA
jgi:hypothetical protein